MSAGKITGTVGFLGFGNMGAAVARGALAAGIISPDRILIHDPHVSADGAGALGCRIAASTEALFRDADAIVLAVKPQVAKAEYSAWSAMLPAGSKKIFISLMAGIRAEALRGVFAGQTVVRVMPNLGLSVGEGATAIAVEGAPEEALALTELIFSSSGATVRVSEEQMDAVTGLSGSGPMYLFEFVEALTQAGVASGFEREAAYKLALQTAKGSLKLLENSTDAPPIWSARVQSKGGTTEAAKKILDAGGFHELLSRAVAAAVARSKELSA